MCPLTVKSLNILSLACIPEHPRTFANLKADVVPVYSSQHKAIAHETKQARRTNGIDGRRWERGSHCEEFLSGGEGVEGVFVNFGGSRDVRPSNLCSEVGM
jgi:hypothetical protein